MTASISAVPRSMGASPIMVAGPDRSGTTLLYALLASHPNVAMVRRTNVWRYFYRRYGDLADERNLERCLHDMLRFKRLRHLEPNGPGIRAAFHAGAPTYGGLFEAFYAQHAQRVGRRRWGDKSLHTEHYAGSVFGEFPDARIIHMVRDPRDRYASARKRHGRDRPRVGGITARWLLSTRRALDNVARHGSGYLIVRYEDLVQDPIATLTRVCEFVGEPFDERMLVMDGATAYRDRGGNSSFGDVRGDAISTTAVGRFRAVLSPSEIAFIQTVAGREMAALGYEPVPSGLHGRARTRYLVVGLPVQFARMIGWTAVARLWLRRGERIPPAKLQDELLEAAGERPATGATSAAGSIAVASPASGAPPAQAEP